MTRIGIAIALALAATAASAQTYRWVDRDGKVHFTDAPPPAFARDVQKRARDVAPADGAQGSFDLQQAQKKYPVVLYTAEPCVPCKDARELLGKRGVPYREVAVGSAETREELKKVAGEMEVPVLTVGKEVQRGFEPSLYNAALDTAGYPRSAPPGTQQAARPAPRPQPAAEAKPPADEAPRGRYTPMAPPDAPAMDAAKGRYLPQ
jgi:glutaredoxin